MVVALKVVGAHPTSFGMIEADLLQALERRVAALEQELGTQQAIASSEPAQVLQELKLQMDAFKTKLETTEYLSWLGKLFFFIVYIFIFYYYLSLGSFIFILKYILLTTNLIFFISFKIKKITFIKLITFNLKFFLHESYLNLI